MNYCNFCFNAHVDNKIPKKEEDYESFLDDTNDFSSCDIGTSDKHISLMLNTGHGEATNIEVREWGKWGKDDCWHTVAVYYLKYCPECGRKLDEYHIDERGRHFTRKEEF